MKEFMFWESQLRETTSLSRNLARVNSNSEFPRVKKGGLKRRLKVWALELLLKNSKMLQSKKTVLKTYLTSSRVHKNTFLFKWHNKVTERRDPDLKVNPHSSKLA